jgi:hypothetical protein
MAAAIFKVQQLVSIVFDEKGEFFSQRHWL